MWREPNSISIFADFELLEWVMTLAGQYAPHRTVESVSLVIFSAYFEDVFRKQTCPPSSGQFN